MNDKKTSNKLIILAIVIVMIVIAVLLFTIGYSRFTSSKNAGASGEIATMICEMSVQSSEKSDTIINPYCTITVSDYNNSKTTETDIGFTIEVTPRDNIVLPEFEWQDSSGRVIARSTDTLDQGGNVIARTAEFPKQTFKNGVRQDKVYKIVFKNTGEEEITRLVKFDLHAVQEPAE